MSSNAVTLVVLVVVFAGMLAFTARARRRQAERLEAQAAELTVGSEVMTTSGLYGRVVARNDDDTVQLAIAPGIEVRWALAALRDVASLPQRYHKPRQHDARQHDTRQHDTRQHDDGNGPAGTP